MPQKLSPDQKAAIGAGKGTQQLGVGEAKPVVKVGAIPSGIGKIKKVYRVEATFDVPHTGYIIADNKQEVEERIPNLTEWDVWDDYNFEDMTSIDKVERLKKENVLAWISRNKEELDKTVRNT